MAREYLIMALYIIKLQQQKALRDSYIGLYNHLQKIFQNMPSSTNLNPMQVENNDKAMEKPLELII